MKADLPIAIPQRLQGGDLGSLQLYQAGEYDIHEKGGHAEEDERHDRGPDPELTHLLLENVVRGLPAAPHGGEATIAVENAVHLAEHGLLGRPGLHPEHQVIECPLHLERRRDRAPVHPQHGKPLVVHPRAAARRHGIDDLRRGCQAHDEEPVQASIDDRR